MSYATTTQVKAMFRNLTENATNKAVTDPTIQEWLDEAQQVINSRFKYFYVVPITGTDSLLIVRKIERLIVASQVDDTLNSYTDKQKKPQYLKNAMDMLDCYAPKPDPKTCKLCDPTAQLPDDLFLGQQNTERRFKASVTDVAPTFKKGVDTW